MLNSVPMSQSDEGLPANIDAEKLVLGSLLLDGARFIEIAGVLLPDDFALEKHRRIFHRMSELHDHGEKIDPVTVANELLRRNELESIGGLSYLVSLDGLPHTSNPDSYVRIIQNKARPRRIAMASQRLTSRAWALLNIIAVKCRCGFLRFSYEDFASDGNEIGT